MKPRPKSRPRVLALVLAGGEGGRLEPLTRERAKPAVPFGGSYRLIDFALSNCAHSNLSDVWVIEQYEPHALNDHLANGRPWDLDRTRGGLQVLPPYQGREGEGFAQGNADAIHRHRDSILEFAPDLVLTLSADHVYRLDYRDVIERHLESGAELTAVTTRVPREEASRFGVVTVEGGRLTGFAYKPKEPHSDLATTEVFVYDTARLLNTLGELADEGELRDFGHGLLPRLVARGGAHEFRLEGYWRDVGTLESYWSGHMDLLGPKPPLRLDAPGWPVLTRDPQRPPARVRPGSLVEDGLLSPGCDVAGRVERSVLAPGVVVVEGAVVRDSVLLHDVVVGRGATVDGAILDEGVRVGEGATVGQPGEPFRRPASALTVVPRRAEVPAGNRLEPG